MGSGKKALEELLRNSGDPRFAGDDFTIGTNDPTGGYGMIGDIPLVGELVGADQAAAKIQEKQGAAKIQAELDALSGKVPTWDQLTPEYEMLGASQAAGASADPAAIEAQRRALRGLEEVYRGGGMTAADRGALAEGQRQQGSFMRGQRESALQNAAERGLGGGGAALAAQMAGSQDSASALASSNAQVNIAAQQRALQAMQAAGGMGSQMRGQSFGEASSRGTAADRFTMANTDTRNRQADRGADAHQQVYTNQERIAALRTGQHQSAIDEARKRREAADKTAGDTVTTVFGALAGG